MCRVMKLRFVLLVMACVVGSGAVGGQSRNSGVESSQRALTTCPERSSSEEETPSRVLTVLITGIGSDDGQVGVALFASPLGFPFQTSRAVRTAFAAIHDHRSRVTFGGVKPGTYALAVFDDTNGNGKLDRDWFGFLVERTAVSNNPKRHIHKPRFDEAMFTLRESCGVEIRFQ
jgi:uncharacterized protein (DUF2141 family)